MKNLPCCARALGTLALLVLLLLPATAEAQFNYAVTNGAITITAYSGPGGAVSIPSQVNDVPVTTIGLQAFQYCMSLTSVTMPNSITSVGSGAFANCYGLASVTIGSGVISIGDEAFSWCLGLTSVTIPNSVTSIGQYAFSDCTSLASVTIGNSVTNIGESAFTGCASITNITVGDRVANIEQAAFEYCGSLTGVYFQGGAPGFGRDVFWADDATVYYLPGSTGWGPVFADCPAVMWNPQPQPRSLGVRTNRFGFNITGSSNLVLVVEASTNLTTWTSLTTGALQGNPLYFSDPQWTNYASRFYRLRWP